jgi:hypothetical protein
MMTGLWNIVGFKHVIEDGNIASYFNIIKDPNSTLPPYTLARKTSKDIIEELSGRVS